MLVVNKRGTCDFNKHEMFAKKVIFELSKDYGNVQVIRVEKGFGREIRVLFNETDILQFLLRRRDFY